jgi:hypothetical protein
MTPWRADGPLPGGLPEGAAPRMEVAGVAVGETPVDVTCVANVEMAQLNCTVALAAPAVK